MARIDVVIPCYNYGRFLSACVRSVLEQSAGDLRVLIIDDASQDNSALVARMLARSDGRVSIIAHTRNRGHIRTYNEGIEWAESEYFLLLSADDLLVAGALDRAVRVMDENPDIVLTYGNCVAWYDNFPLPVIDASGPFTWVRTDLVRDMCATATNFVPTPTAIVRTSVQKEIGGYLPALPHAGDLEMWLRFAARGGVARIRSVQAIYRKHGSAMSNSYWENILRDYRQRKSAFDRFFELHGDRIAGLSNLRKTTDHVLAGKAFQSGLGSLRRGRIGDGVQLLRWAMNVDRRLRYFPPLWRLLKLPGSDGRRWAADVLKSATRRVVERSH